jgi:hypothetical protein
MTIKIKFIISTNAQIFNKITSQHKNVYKTMSIIYLFIFFLKETDIGVNRIHLTQSRNHQ